LAQPTRAYWVARRASTERASAMSRHGWLGHSSLTAHRAALHVREPAPDSVKPVIVECDVEAFARHRARFAERAGGSQVGASAWKEEFGVRAAAGGANPPWFGVAEAEVAREVHEFVTEQRVEIVHHRHQRYNASRGQRP